MNSHSFKRLSHLLTVKFKRFYVFFKKLSFYFPGKMARSGPEAGLPSHQAATSGSRGVVGPFRQGTGPPGCRSPRHSPWTPELRPSGGCGLLPVVSLHLGSSRLSIFLWLFGTFEPMTPEDQKGRDFGGTQALY